MVALSPARQKFILHWGEMGPKWGVNRSVAQIHALLFLSKGPLTAEEIADALSLARSNVSTSLKELLGWRIVRLVHVMGDRRDHFESLQDVWEMFQIVLDERKRRDGRPLEFLGTYDPKPEVEVIKLRAEAIEAWIAKGAQMSDAVRNLMAKQRKEERAAAAAAGAA